MEHLSHGDNATKFESKILDGNIRGSSEDVGCNAPSNVWFQHQSCSSNDITSSCSVLAILNVGVDTWDREVELAQAM
jgi:hypothetical protein